MLTRLFISNIVLIEKLELEFRGGLSALTGETGAGKSILLDALALALGARSDTGLVRHGTDTASVVADFDLGAKEMGELGTFLQENGIEYPGGALTLRRTLGADGKSRAWVNDIPVSVKILKAVGDQLVEIHAQFENHSLLNPATHIFALDEFGNYNDLLADIAIKYKEFHNAERRLKELSEMIERSAAEREFLEHNVKELLLLKPQIGEEEELSTKRAALMDTEKNAGILSDASELLNQKGRSLDSQIFSVAHILERIKTNPNPYKEQIDKLYEIAETVGEIAEHIAPADLDTANLENIESRLFAIRAAARKFRIGADELPEKFLQMSEQLNAIDNSDTQLKYAKIAVAAARTEFDAVSAQLTIMRGAAATKLRTAILNELPDLKLAAADFDVEITPIAPSINGADAVTFLIKTNPGTPFAALHKIASGGEMSRLMLALRVVLMNKNNSTKTFIFDEIDTGISGGTAAAVGQRLARLAADSQAIVITHSAQVAGCADNHYLIEKFSDKDITTTTVKEISNDARLNEIARIISGEKITNESIATAKTLIK